MFVVVPVSISGTDVCRTVQVVSWSLHPACRLSECPFSILSISCLSGAVPLWKSYPWHREIPKQVSSPEPSKAVDRWKAVELNPLFIRVQLLYDFALWRLLISPGSCFSVNRREGFCAVSLLCLQKDQAETSWGCWGDGVVSITTAEPKQWGEQSGHLELQL